MLPFEDRYSRQRKLPEVGPQGQLALARSSLQVTSRVVGSEIFELSYLRRAGVENVTLSSLQVEPCSAHATQFHFAAPRTLAVGALGALAQLRRELGMSERSS
jgi:hypothetical protein